MAEFFLKTSTRKQSFFGREKRCFESHGQQQAHPCDVLKHGKHDRIVFFDGHLARWLKMLRVSSIALSARHLALPQPYGSTHERCPSQGFSDVCPAVAIRSGSRRKRGVGVATHRPVRSPLGQPHRWGHLVSFARNRQKKNLATALTVPGHDFTQGKSCST